MNLNQTDRQLHIDFLRGVAAQLVLIGHAFSLFVLKSSSTVSGNEISTHWITQTLWRFIGIFVGRGADAVVVFFVLSGLLVGASVIRQIEANRFQFGDYIVKRIVRLQTVILPGLLISGVLIWLSFQLGAGASVIVQNTPWYPVDWPVQESMSMSTLACNAVFLQTIFCSQYAHNSSLWSLTNEFHYYLAFPMILLVLTASKQSLAVRFACFIGFCLVVGLWLYPYWNSAQFYRSLQFFTGGLIWIVGAYVPWGLSKYGKPFNSYFSHVMWFAVAALLLLLYLKSVGSVRTLSVVLLTIWLLSYADTLNKWLGRSELISRSVKLLSDFSFSLYVIHVPILFVFLSFFDELLVKQLPTLSGLVVFAFILLITNFLAYGFYFLFEKNFLVIHARIKTITGKL
jgi:peptidoglycan/LPS O-acetylase OafA/YrhL